MFPCNGRRARFNRDAYNARGAFKSRGAFAAPPSPQPARAWSCPSRCGSTFPAESRRGGQACAAGVAVGASRARGVSRLRGPRKLHYLDLQRGVGGFRADLARFGGALMVFRRDLEGWPSGFRRVRGAFVVAS